MTTPSDFPSLLALPLELREQVYKDVLTSPLCGPQLLQTCHEVYNEAYKFLYQRPILFAGQTSLYHWIHETSGKYLPYVMEITVEVQDVDLRPLLTSSSPSQEDASPRLMTWDLYERELQRLRQALEQVYNVRSLTVRTIASRQSHLYRDFLGRFLNGLGSIWPRLHRLCLDGHFHHQSITFVSSLPELRSLSFDGYSATVDTKIATVLSSLKHLTSLALVSRHTLCTPTEHVHNTSTSKLHSFNDKVLQAMNPLASFAVTERTQLCPSPALFFTPEILVALQTHSTLRNLSIKLSHPPNTETLEALETFLAKSSISRLELDWPNLTSDVLDTYALLPRDLGDLWFRSTSTITALNIIRHALKSREEGTLPGLRRVVLMRGSQDQHKPKLIEENDSAEEKLADTEEEVVRDGKTGGDDGTRSHDGHTPTEDTDGDDMTCVIRQLNALGVLVSWYTDPA